MHWSIRNPFSRDTDEDRWNNRKAILSLYNHLPICDVMSMVLTQSMARYQFTLHWRSSSSSLADRSLRSLVWCGRQVFLVYCINYKRSRDLLEIYQNSVCELANWAFLSSYRYLLMYSASRNSVFLAQNRWKFAQANHHAHAFRCCDFLLHHTAAAT